MVRILNVVDGCIPSDLATGSAQEIEEERRLLYVAMTRSKDVLDLIVPHRFFTRNQGRDGDRHVYANLSRFLPDSIHHVLDRRGWAEDKPATQSSRTRTGQVIDVRASIKAMWKRRSA